MFCIFIKYLLYTDKLVLQDLFILRPPLYWRPHFINLSFFLCFTLHWNHLWRPDGRLASKNIWISIGRPLSIDNFSLICRGSDNITSTMASLEETTTTRPSRLPPVSASSPRALPESASSPRALPASASSPRALPASASPARLKKRPSDEPMTPQHAKRSSHLQKWMHLLWNKKWMSWNSSTKVLVQGN